MEELTTSSVYTSISQKTFTPPYSKPGAERLGCLLPIHGKVPSTLLLQRGCRSMRSWELRLSPRLEFSSRWRLLSLFFGNCSIPCDDRRWGGNGEEGGNREEEAGNDLVSLVPVAS